MCFHMTYYMTIVNPAVPILLFSAVEWERSNDRLLLQPRVLIPKLSDVLRLRNCCARSHKRRAQSVRAACVCVFVVMFRNKFGSEYLITKSRKKRQQVDPEAADLVGKPLAF